MKEKFDDNKIDSLFNEKLGKEEIAPREIVWTRISHELGREGGKKKPVAWIWWLSGIALLVTIGTWVGIAAYQNNNDSSKNKLAENKTGWKYNEPANGGFEKVPYESQGGDTGVVLIEGGNFTPGKADSSAQHSENNSAQQNSVNANENSTVKSNGHPHKKNNNHSLPVSRDHDAALSSGNKPAESKKNNPANKKSNDPDSSSQKHIALIPQHGYPDEKPGNDNIIPPTSLVHDKNDVSNPPGNENVAEHPGKADSSLVKNKTGDPGMAKSIATDEPPMYHAAYTDSILKADSIAVKKAPVVKTDSSQTKTDSSKAVAAQLPPFIFPGFFISMHGGVDAGKIVKVDYNIPENSPTEVQVYNKEKIKSTPQQTYAYGVRFGWFVKKRISFNFGGYYSIFETDGNEGNFKYNHNNELIFKMNTPTSSVNCASSHFDYHDSNVLQGDTFYIDVRSHEKYDYLGLQAGVALYALRTKHFGVYGALYQNGSFLTKKYMEITVPKSGKEIAWSGKKVIGMNPFVLSEQTALGFEWLPFGNFGLWVEPSFYFSAKLNAENSVAIRPGGMKYLAGISWHF
jgi:hypothetical protein